jgi:hypothetical protein
MQPKLLPGEKKHCMFSLFHLASEICSQLRSCFCIHETNLTVAEAPYIRGLEFRRSWGNDNLMYHPNPNSPLPPKIQVISRLFLNDKQNDLLCRLKNKFRNNRSLGELLVCRGSKPQNLVYFDGFDQFRFTDSYLLDSAIRSLKNISITVCEAHVA